MFVGAEERPLPEFLHTIEIGPPQCHRSEDSNRQKPRKFPTRFHVGNCRAYYNDGFAEGNDHDQSMPLGEVFCFKVPVSLADDRRRSHLQSPTRQPPPLLRISHERPDDDDDRTDERRRNDGSQGLA